VAGRCSPASAQRSQAVLVPCRHCTSGAPACATQRNVLGRAQRLVYVRSRFHHHKGSLQRRAQDEESQQHLSEIKTSFVWHLDHTAVLMAFVLQSSESVGWHSSASRHRDVHQLLQGAAGDVIRSEDCNQLHSSISSDVGTMAAKID
jgi:hypothetical protein